MVTITNGVVTFDVPAGAQKCIFARQGYYPVTLDDADCAEVNKELDKVDEMQRIVVELREKPLSQWTKDEVIQYASINGIDISGTKGPNEAKHIIQKYMQEHPEG